MSREALASAVILPEADLEAISPPRASKRRHSSTSDSSSKRARTIHDASKVKHEDVMPLQSATSDPQPGRRKASGQMEERKRGQRLFGALLGTLSQSSSSTAQKRRSDIDQKQQAKLRLQAKEHDEKKKQKLDALIEVRRKEQIKYDKQSMHIRHTNLLSQAHFLQTKAIPRLFYKPWELTKGDGQKIKDQIKEVEGLIEQDLSQHEAEDSPKSKSMPPEIKKEGRGEQPELGAAEGETAVDFRTDREQLEIAKDDNAEDINTADHDSQSKGRDQPENSKDTGDDGGEVVEGEEDTVIY